MSNVPTFGKILNREKKIIFSKIFYCIQILNIQKIITLAESLYIRKLLNAFLYANPYYAFIRNTIFGKEFKGHTFKKFPFKKIYKKLLSILKYYISLKFQHNIDTSKCNKNNS